MFFQVKANCPSPATGKYSNSFRPSLVFCDFNDHGKALYFFDYFCCGRACPPIKVQYTYTTMIRRTISILLCLAAIVSCGRDRHLPRAEYPGAEAFDKVFEDVWSHGTDELHSMMVLKDGKVIYERYETGHRPDDLNILWSASKTFTATAVGFACQDGLLSVNDKAIRYFNADDLPQSPSPWLQQMTVRDLLVMSSGLGADIRERTRGNMRMNWARETLVVPMRFEPGSRFEYNSMDTYLLSVIVSRVTGRTVEDYLAEKLFRPLGIREWHWDLSPQGYTTGGWGLFLKLEDFAKMGQFMLQRGEWKGKRLLDEAWFDDAMSPQIMQYKGKDVSDEWLAGHKDDEGQQGYGYQMWCCTHGAYRLDGAWCQFCIVMPDKDAVVAMFSHSRSGRRMLESVWRNVYDNL